MVVMVVVVVVVLMVMMVLMSLEWGRVYPHIPARCQFVVPGSLLQPAAKPLVVVVLHCSCRKAAVAGRGGTGFARVSAKLFHPAASVPSH